MQSETPSLLQSKVFHNTDKPQSSKKATVELWSSFSRSPTFLVFNSSRGNTSKGLDGHQNTAAIPMCHHLAMLCAGGTQPPRCHSCHSVCFQPQISAHPATPAGRCSYTLLSGKEKQLPSSHPLDRLVWGKERSSCLTQCYEVVQLLHGLQVTAVVFFSCFISLTCWRSGHVWFQISCFGDHTGNWLQVGRNNEQNKLGRFYYAASHKGCNPFSPGYSFYSRLETLEGANNRLFACLYFNTKTCFLSTIRKNKG